MKQYVISIGLFFLNFHDTFASGFDSYHPSTQRKSSFRWDSANHPKILLDEITDDFNTLPLKGELTFDKMPWSDTYWPRYKGGIVYRWKTDSRPNLFTFKNKTQIFKMTAEDIDKLSPAEKLDLINEDYQFRFSHFVSKQNPRTAATWEGICHGWCPAAILEKQGQPKVLKNRDGIEVRFSTSDINALTSYYYANLATGKTRFMGRRCQEFSSTFDRTPACSDVNAGAFHLVLTNLVGIKNQSFIVDVTPGKEVWNQPVAGYISHVLAERSPSEGSDPLTAREIKVSTQFKYVIEQLPHSKPTRPTFNIEPYEYWLELDVSGKIIGGSWISEAHPDFAWSVEKTDFKGSFEVLKDLL